MSRWSALLVRALVLSSLVVAGRTPHATAEPTVALRANPNERRAVRGRAIEQSRYPAELAVLLASETTSGGGIKTSAGAGVVPAVPVERPPPKGTADGPLLSSAFLPGAWAGTGEAAVADIDAEQADLAGSRTPGVPDAARPLATTLGALPDLDIRLDGTLSRYLDRLSARAEARAAVRGLITRLGHYRPLVENELSAAGLPTDLAFAALAASGFDPGAIGPDGRAGLWMLDQATARAADLHVGFWMDERLDPSLATRAAVLRLGALYGQYGSWPLVLSAYQAGQAVLDAAIRRAGTRDYERLVAQLPSAAVRFVARVQALAFIASNPAGFGLAEIPLDPPIRFEYGMAPSGTSVASIAKALGIPATTVAALNPAFIRQRVPLGASATRVRLPPGTAGRLNTALGAASASEERVKGHPLLPGEALEDVAATYGLSTSALRRLNQITDTFEIRGAELLAVPAHAEARGSLPALPSESSTEFAGDKLMAALPALPSANPGSRVFYRVVEGDTLGDLALAAGVSELDIVACNNLDPQARLQAGMILQLFVDPQREPLRLRLLDPAKVEVVTLGSEDFHVLDAARKGRQRIRYQARGGETLETVGRRFGLAAADLARINRISSRRVLVAGDEVVVYASPPRPDRQASARREIRRERPEAAARRGNGSSRNPEAKGAGARPKRGR